MLTRRRFLQQGSAITAGTFLASSLGLSCLSKKKTNSKKIAASDLVNIGVVGVNGVGWYNLESILKVPGVRLVALCDIDKNVLDKRVKDLAALDVDASGVKICGDHRQLLDMKDVDAVIIATPDHWHCLQMIDACQAGKDIYVEKPVGNSIKECRLMVAAQEKYNRVVQAGQWQRSMQHFKEAVDFVHSGQLGNVRTVKVWCYRGSMKPVPAAVDGLVPPGVDYDRWLGPAPQKQFNINRYHFNFRWFWDYAGGLMTDWGVHLLDYALLGMKAIVPNSISAMGGNFADPSSPQETPDTLCALYEFDRFNLVWDHAMGIGNGLFGKDHGIAFIGTNGTLELDRKGWEVIEESRSNKKARVERKKAVDIGIEKHMENFVNVIRSRKMEELNCPIESASHIAILSQMGNIAYRSGNKLKWDKISGRFTDESINEQYITAAYHNGYRLPIV